jgi:hypothetical protein
MASATGVCSNFGLSGYGGGDRGLSPDGRLIADEADVPNRLGVPYFYNAPPTAN